jgi:hypothetical protein
MNTLIKLVAAVVLGLLGSAFGQVIDVTSYVLPVDPDHRGAEIAEIHPAFDLNPGASDFGGKKLPGVWRSNGLVTGMMGIMRFGPAIASYVCWKHGSEEFCPPFTKGTGGARMTRMQSDAILVEYSPFEGVQAKQLMIAMNERLFCSNVTYSGPGSNGIQLELMGGSIEQSETGHLKDFQRHEVKSLPDSNFHYAISQNHSQGQKNATFCTSFGSGIREVDSLNLGPHSKQSEAFYARVPKFDFHDPQLNLFHRIMWERLRGLAENAAGDIPAPFFMGTSAPWGIDGLWLWDVAFVSQVLQYADPEWAERLIEAVIAQQSKAGLIPHWSTPRSRTEISQPPLLSWAALRLYRAHGDRTFLERVYPHLEAAHHWFEKNRTRPDGLPFWKQPDESGMDNSPAFDENTDAHVDLVAELFADAGMLAEIAGELGHAEDQKEWQKTEQTWRERMERFWDADGGFYFPLKGSQRISSYTVQGLFPLWDPKLLAEHRAALMKRLTDPAEFWTPYPVPSASLKSPQFMQPKWFANTYGSPETGQRIGERLVDYSSVYWRGPVWIFSNAIIYEGLRRSGEFKVSNELGERMVKMIFEAAKHGGMLWENFDPRDGTPSRLLPKGQADEMAASIYYLKALYDSHVGLESAAAPTSKLLHLRYTAAPTADVNGLRFGAWTIAQKVSGKNVEITVLQAPEKDAKVVVDDQSGQQLRIKTLP